ncbi:MAG: PD-(D/E)XK nuclease family protein [Pirellulales bacterium]|nr:PD-(D/E)XK nuclease family protein [Pirellulales bacterium]
MPLNRVFLDWSRSPLESAVDYLVEQFRTENRLDFGKTILAVPGGRAGRRLTELLIDRAEQEKLTLRPPKVVTVGKLPEQLYVAKRPFADSLVQQLAWSRALRQTGAKKLDRVLPAVPAEDDLPGWLGLSGALARLHMELAAENLTFAQVARQGEQLQGFREKKRWQALAEVQQEYLRLLDSLELWDLQTARLVAIQQRECRTDAEIILVGTADLNRVQKLMLDQVASHVKALVIAPEELANRFDAYGCIEPEAWQEAAIPLADEQIAVVGGPAAQATAVVRALAQLGGRYRADQITIGVPDERLVPYIEHQLTQCGIAARYGPGKPASQSPPYRLLAAVAEYLDAERFAALAALVRHPAVTDWLSSRGLNDDWLSLLDDYHSHHFPASLGGQWLGDDDCCRKLPALCDGVRELIGDLLGDERSLDQWCGPILDLLLRVFGEAALDPRVRSDRSVLVACEQIHDVLCSNHGIPAALAPTVTAAEAVELVLDQLAGGQIPPLPAPGAIELLGWLELPLDDAPALIVASVNEGIVPSSLNGDLFLPNQLRRKLGIEDNSRRYARDVYAMGVLCASREKLTVIAGRRTLEGDPLLPSRLLFAADPRAAAMRAKRLFSSEPVSCEAVLLPGGFVPAERSLLKVPPPRPLRRRIDSMRVTEFREYLACPYRYYLRNCLKLSCVSDAAEELDAMAFGTLLHAVLSAFGEGPLAASTDAEDIANFLSNDLDKRILVAYGKTPLPVILIQAEQLRKRLAAFARWQAGWAAEGWRIECVERQPEPGKAVLMVDNEPMVLRGRVDRIDIHEATGARAIFDYKSSNKPEPPEKSHREKGQWVDLQLPLYRHLAAGMGIDGPIQLGYIVLPKDPTRVDALLAQWTEEDLAQADRTAEEVVRRIRAEIFWPPASPPPAWFEEFAGICQDDRLIAVALAEQEEEGAES